MDNWRYTQHRETEKEGPEARVGVVISDTTVSIKHKKRLALFDTACQLGGEDFDQFTVSTAEWLKYLMFLHFGFRVRAGRVGILLSLHAVVMSARGGSHMVYSY